MAVGASLDRSLELRQEPPEEFDLRYLRQVAEAEREPRPEPVDLRWAELRLELEEGRIVVEDVEEVDG